ncbi:S10 family peptidase [Tundrisphaera sp. TA3]|uniref:S10 family peptidase n=1 Tax=Tundrisphaera sp. TA3 TaxID=3435775 RepID=UPI003EB96B03
MISPSRTARLTFALAALLPAPGFGQSPPPAAAAKAEEKPAEKGKPGDPVVTHHEIGLAGQPLKYTATAGFLPIANDEGVVEANIFYMAYHRDEAGPAGNRPLTFAFNGGPGSASLWLHIGAIGPRKVEFPDAAQIPAPPFRLVDNPSTWLDRTDLIFIDPVGTGFSRAAKPELNKKFHGLQGDLDSVGEFIRLYLTRNDRWGSPLFLAGESYGTTRAAGLSDRLIERGIAVNGIVLMSTVLNFQTLSTNRGNDLAYILFLPTYTATAWYHRKLSEDLLADRAGTLAEAARWAESDYTVALMQGDRLSPEKRKEVAAKLASLTGLDPTYVERSNLRIEPTRFRKELLRDQGRTVGRFDTRFLGSDELGVTDRPEEDPSYSAIRPAFTAAFNQYVRSELGYKNDLPYFVLGEGVGAWDYGTTGRIAADTSESLRSAWTQNPHLRVLVASGLYDLATPYRAAEYTFAHMGLDPGFRRRLRVEEYDAGHMMYLHAASLAKLRADVGAFLDDAPAK